MAGNPRRLLNISTKNTEKWLNWYSTKMWQDQLVLVILCGHVLCAGAVYWPGVWIEGERCFLRGGINNKRLCRMDRAFC